MSVAPRPDSEVRWSAPVRWVPPRREPRRWSLLFIVIPLFLSGLIGLQASFWAIRPYFLKAQNLDLDQLTRQQVGCQVVDGFGEPLGRIFVSNLEPVSLSQLPPHFLEALIATEDARFWKHKGIDPEGMLRAAWHNAKASRITQGGSTITQQLARAVYGLEDRTLARKLTEFFLALRIERHYSKEEIMEQYLNRIYWGSGSWGVGAAAKTYFRKPVEDLTIEESTLLCAVIKRPSGYSPHVNASAALAARNRTLQRMADLGYLTAADSQHFQQQPLGVSPRRVAANGSGFLLDRVQQEADEILDRIGAPGNRLTIHISLDLDLQRRSHQLVQQFLTQLESAPGYEAPRFENYAFDVNAPLSGQRPDYLQAAVVVLENRTGRILSYVGGRNYHHSQFDRVSRARRPAGSAILPLLYAAAFDEPALTPRTRLLDLPIDNRKVMIGGEHGVLGEWNSLPAAPFFEGEITAARALFCQKNAASLRLGAQLGLENFHRFLQKAGVTSPLKPFPSSMLGHTELSLLELTRAMSCLPLDGRRPPSPGLVDYVTDPSGAVIYRRPEQPGQALIDPDSARAVSRILQEALRERAGSTLEGAPALCSLHAAGTTGMVYGQTDAWSMVFDGRYTCGVWTGFDQPSPLNGGGRGETHALPLASKLFNELGSDAPLSSPDATDASGRLLCDHQPYGAASVCRCALHAPWPEGSLREAHQPGLHLTPVAASPVGAHLHVVPPSVPVVSGPDPYRRGETLKVSQTK